MAQDNLWLWPIKGEKNVENIIYKPQTYIEKELNFDNLFIGASEGDTVIAPVDGVIDHFFYTYYESLNYSSVRGIEVLNDKKNRINIANSYSKPIDPKYISVIVSIKTKTGKVINISGLRPVKIFKTGEKISRGEVIGNVGYVYYKIPEPCILISVSENRKPSDPMSPFGIKTSFISPKDIKYKGILSAEEMKSDLLILTDALKEGHPGLYDYVSKFTFDVLIKNIFSSIKQPISTGDFKNLLTTIISCVHDSHLNILSTGNPGTSAKETFFPIINFGWLNDSLIVNRTIESDKNYLGRKILKVDGIAADSLKRFLSLYMSGTDGYIESYPDFNLLTLGTLQYLKYHPKASKRRDLRLTFVNGKTVIFKGERIEGKSCVSLHPKWKKFYLANKYKTDNFQLKKMSNQTAYIGLSTFDLNEIEIEKIENFIKNISESSYKNLIIDVRNNYGGEEQNVDVIFSLIAQQPFSQQVLRKVNKKNRFKFFSNCLNYSVESHNIFSGYNFVKGKDGFYYFNDSSDIKPNLTNNFKGKIYVLTNERSFSASTNFAALVHKYKRGVIVGRESGSAYYHMNAEKFADLRLPNSGIVIQIPLIQVVFDTIKDPAISWGRGVIPDYPVSFTLKELAWENGDSILNYTRELIEQSKYLPEDSVTLPNKYKNEVKTSNSYNYLYVLTGIFVLVLILYYLKKK